MKIERCDYGDVDKAMEKNGKKYRKRPIVIKAMQIQIKFEVETKEGIMKGKAGDFLIRGIQGEYYPCDKEIFKQTYEEI